MIVAFFFCVVSAVSTFSVAMDENSNNAFFANVQELTGAVENEVEEAKKSELSYGEVCAKKIQLIRDTFTNDTNWRKVLAEEGALFLAYRKASTHHEMPRLPVPSEEQRGKVLTYAYQKQMMYALPIVTYADDTLMCIGCNDTSLHLWVGPQKGSQQHIYIPPCHTRRITSITAVTADTIAIAGGNAITFCNIHDKTYTHKRIVFVDLPMLTFISGITKEQKQGALVFETSNQLKQRQQFILYPYNEELYHVLRGKGLSDSQLQVACEAAEAVHENKQLQFTDLEDKCYETLPRPLQDHIDYFLVKLYMDQKKEREEQEVRDATAEIDHLVQQLIDPAPAQ